LLAISLIIASCKSKTEQAASSDSELIEITKAQFESEKMVIGEPALYPFADLVNFTGTIIPDITGQAQISIPLPGIINKIYYKPGQVIAKGSLLFEVSGNEFIDMQKDFAESTALLSRLKSDFYRSKVLYNDSISTQKEFISAESSYYAEIAKHNALKIKLENMGLDVSVIEKGEFYKSYSLKSPIKGFISSIDVTMGQYVDPQQKIAEIIDAQSYQLRLAVFEKNINKIKTGQQVVFYLGGNKSEKYFAKINSIGKTIMNDSKSIDCYATLEINDNATLVSNQFVEGEIYTQVDTALAVPETAIITSENDVYLLILEKEDEAMYYFKKMKVSTVRKNNNYIELPKQLNSIKLLVNGIYNIQIE
jgi:cobalt-zinc-cadmium efflux system membrane fusion protein